jgi:hypothetical protein
MGKVEGTAGMAVRTSKVDTVDTTLRSASRVGNLDRDTPGRMPEIRRGKPRGRVPDRQPRPLGSLWP